MSTQLTNAEIENFARLLQNYDPGKIALTILINNNGQIQQSFEQLWTEKYGKQDFGSKSIWESTLTVLRQELCGDEGIKNQVKEYSKNPTSAPLGSPLLCVITHAYGFMESFHSEPFTVIFSRLVISMNHFHTVKGRAIRFAQHLWVA